MHDLPEGFCVSTELIDSIPTVDIVWCKDCINWNNIDGICWCEINSRMDLSGNWNMFAENDFCSYGERKADEVKSDKIKDLGVCELLCQLAEEAAELSQAALKLRRALDGKNPTPRTVDECKGNLLEELSDVATCITVLKDDIGYSNGAIFERGRMKMHRWERRLEALEDEPEQVEYTEAQCGREK